MKYLKEKLNKESIFVIFVNLILSFILMIMIIFLGHKTWPNALSVSSLVFICFNLLYIISTKSIGQGMWLIWHNHRNRVKLKRGLYVDNEEKNALKDIDIIKFRKIQKTKSLFIPITNIILNLILLFISLPFLF